MKDHLRLHREILAEAAVDRLPKRIERDDAARIGVVRELVEAGHLTAILSNALEGASYFQPRITISGREYLNILDKRQYEASLKGRAVKAGLLFIGWLMGVLSSVVVSWLTKAS